MLAFLFVKRGPPIASSSDKISGFETFYRSCDVQIETRLAYRRFRIERPIGTWQPVRQFRNLSRHTDFFARP